MFGLPKIAVPAIDRYLTEGERFKVGNVEVLVFETPGHSPGSVTLQAGPSDLIVGDVLFAGSIGRTDLPGGSLEVLIGSIKERLLCLDDGLKVLSGHGPPTSIGLERAHNPFLTGRL